MVCLGRRGGAWERRKEGRVVNGYDMNVCLLYVIGIANLTYAL
jgi:hypothetical protein